MKSVNRLVVKTRRQRSGPLQAELSRSTGSANFSKIIYSEIVNTNYNLI
jgi:hypothetical protein